MLFRGGVNAFTQTLSTVIINLAFTQHYVLTLNFVLAQSSLNLAV